MAPKPSLHLLSYFIFPALLLTLLYSTLLPLSPPKPLSSLPISRHCNLFNGTWVSDPTRRPLYDDTCPFHRNSWNCLRNKRADMDRINSWRWVPEGCDLGRIDPGRFLGLMRGKRIGFVGDSLSENFVVGFVCVLRGADDGARKWKKMGAWRGAYFPKFDVTVAYHRAVLLGKYQLGPVISLATSVGVMNFLEHQNLDHMTVAGWQPKQSTDDNQDGLKGIHRVDIDIPADDWADVTKFYDVLIFNTGHWWGYDKFPEEKPLVFFKGGRPINPPLNMMDGLKAVLESMISYIQQEVPAKTLKFWRLQSPRHFYGGEWNQNGSCLFNEPLKEHQLDSWFDPSNNGVNKEARVLNIIIREALQGSDIQLLDLNHLSEFRADAHPAIWLGKKDAVAVWGQDCLHWCLPGVPDTWVDILAQLILVRSFGRS